MPSWEGKSKGVPWGYKFFVSLIKKGGVKPAYFILHFVAFYYFLFSWESSGYILYFYRSRLGFSLLKSYYKLYQNYYIFGQTLIDKVAVLSGLGSSFSFDFDGEDNLRQMVALKKGGLLLSAHAGNYEAAGHLLKRMNTRINIVMYDGEDAQIKKHMEAVNEERAFQIIFIKNDLSHIFKIHEALAANEIVCIHADRFRPENKTLTAKFFGKEALFPEGPFLLALKLKVPVAFVYAFKESQSHYHFYSSDLKFFASSNGDTLQTVLTEYIKTLEKMLLRYPEQWFNYHDFWKTN
jgi:predicted LPLAT superfamily acyltransferase